MVRFATFMVALALIPWADLPSAVADNTRADPSVGFNDRVDRVEAALELAESSLYACKAELLSARIWGDTCFGVGRDLDRLSAMEGDIGYIGAYLDTSLATKEQKVRGANMFAKFERIQSTASNVQGLGRLIVDEMKAKAARQTGESTK